MKKVLVLSAAAVLFACFTVLGAEKEAAPGAPVKPAAEKKDVVKQELTAELKIGTNVDKEKRKLEGEAESFPSTVGRLWCFATVKGATTDTEIKVVWYHEGDKMASIPLIVKNPTHRTWANKKIMPEWTGNWTVKLVDEDGKAFAEKSFKVVEEAEKPAAEEKKEPAKPAVAPAPVTTK